MNRIRMFLAASIVVAPFAVGAQTVNTPGGQAATGSSLDQTRGSPSETAPKRTRTTPDMTDPSGALPTKSGAPHGAVDSTAAKKARRSGATNTTQQGDVPTYPAPAPDGTPTK